MSDYYLVDKTLLDDGLKEVADAIRQGSGISGELSFPTGMAEAAQKSGMPEIFGRLISLTHGFLGDSTLPETLNLDLSFMSAAKCVLYQTFRSCTSLKNVVLTIPDGAKLTLGLCFYGCTELKKVRLQGAFIHASADSVSGASVALGAFAMCSKLEEIVSDVPFGAKYISNQAQYYNSFFDCKALKEVRFERAIATTDWIFKWSAVLSDETLISVANALVLGTYTLTLHPTAYARCAEIKGREDADVEGEVFIADENGDITLEDYITGTKGWSLANG